MKFVFLDRDGVINEFPGNGNYVTKVKNFRFLPGSLEAIHLLTQAGFTIFVISNQAGVAKKVYSLEKLNHITRNMLREVKKSDGKIKGVFYCMHKSDADCGCRKPGTGLIEKALKSVNKPLSAAAGSSFFVGDTKSDMLAGFNARCKTIFVLSGRAKRKDVRKWGIIPDFIAKDLLEATKLIVHLDSLT